MSCEHMACDGAEGCIPWGGAAPVGEDKKLDIVSASGDVEGGGNFWLRASVLCNDDHMQLIFGSAESSPHRPLWAQMNPQGGQAKMPPIQHPTRSTTIKFLRSRRMPPPMKSRCVAPQLAGARIAIDHLPTALLPAPGSDPPPGQEPHRHRAGDAALRRAAAGVRGQPISPIAARRRSTMHIGPQR